MTETSILEIRDVVLDLGKKRILDHLSIQFWPGHVHAVVGPNGVGKSTLADTIMGLSGYMEFSGDILFEGQSLKGLSIDQRARKGITLGWQEPALIKSRVGKIDIDYDAQCGRHSIIDMSARISVYDSSG